MREVLFSVFQKISKNPNEKDDIPKHKNLCFSSKIFYKKYHLFYTEDVKQFFMKTPLELRASRVFLSPKKMIYLGN